MSEFKEKKYSTGMRPVPWGKILWSSILGIILAAGLFYVWQRRHAPPKINVKKSDATIINPKTSLNQDLQSVKDWTTNQLSKGTQTANSTTSTVAASLSESQKRIDALVAGAKQKLDDARAYANGPEGEKFRAQIEETRRQIEEFSYRSAEKSRGALDRAITEGGNVATSLRERGKGDLATDLEQSIQHLKDETTSLINKGASATTRTTAADSVLSTTLQR